MRPFMRTDSFAVDKPGGRYQVTSVYLDSADLVLYGMTAQGIKNRFKLRMRWYDDDEEQPVFIEIKRRVDQVVRKRRVAVDVGLANRVLDLARGQAGADREALGDNPAVREFATLATRSAAQPLVLVRYWREPYESRGPDPVRITFDTTLEYAMTTTGALLGRGEELQWRTTPQDGAIIEIKFTELHPAWVRDLINHLQLQKQSVPKYCLSVEEAIRRGDFRSAPFDMRARASWGG